jgi:hypothetical protein
VRARQPGGVTWANQRLTVQRHGGNWVLCRGTARIASSRDHGDMLTLACRIADRERSAAAREKFLHGRPTTVEDPP